MSREQKGRDLRIDSLQPVQRETHSGGGVLVLYGPLFLVYFLIL